MDVAVQIEKALAEGDDIRPAAPVPTNGWARMPQLFLSMYRNPIEAWADVAYEEWIVDRCSPFLNLFFVSEPDSIAKILVDKTGAYGVSRSAQRLLKPAIGESLPLAEGTRWRQQRRALAPAFRPASSDKYIPSIEQSARDTAYQWMSAGLHQVNVSEASGATALVALAQTMFSWGDHRSLNELRAASTFYRNSAGQIDIGTFLNLPPWIPSFSRMRAKRVVERFEFLLFDEVSCRRKMTDPGSDLLGLMLKARDAESGFEFDDELIRDNVAFMFAAGHETTAASIGWALYLLALFPKVQNVIAEEVASVLNRGSLDAGDVEQLKGLRMVVDEALRLYPPLPHTGRDARRDDKILGHVIPRGSVMFISPYIIHRHRRLWERPDYFDPTRFSSEKKQHIHKFAYIPFGAGPKICIGAHFAITQIMVVLSVWLSKFQFSLPEGSKPYPLAQITMHPREPLVLNIRQR